MFGRGSSKSAAQAASKSAGSGGSTTGLVTAALVVSSVLVTGYRIATTGIEGEEEGETSAVSCQDSEQVESGRENRAELLGDKVLKATSISSAVSERRYSHGESSPGHRADTSGPVGTLKESEAEPRSRTVGAGDLVRSQSLGDASPSCRASPMERSGSVTATSSMERVTGRLQKQGDMLGLWRHRYFELGSYDPVELEAFPQVDKEFKSSQAASAGRRDFFLLYWSCDANQARTDPHRNQPRGMFLLRDARVTHESPLTLVLTGLVNAFKPSAPVPVMKLAASQARSVQKWASAFAFTAVASALPAASFQGCRPFPMPAKSGTLGRPATSQGEAALNSYFRLYSWASDRDNSISNDEDDNAVSEEPKAFRTFLLSWESEQRADMRPLRPRNVYELTEDCKAYVTLEHPCVIVLENVDDFCFANAQPVSSSKRSRKLALKTSDPQAAAEWANALVPHPERCTVEQPVVEAFVGGEDVVDEYIPPGMSSAGTTPEQNLQGNYSRDDVYFPEGEEIMDEFVADNMNDSALSGSISGMGSLNGSGLDLSLSSVDELNGMNSLNDSGDSGTRVGATREHDDESIVLQEQLRGLYNQRLGLAEQTIEGEEEGGEYAQYKESEYLPAAPKVASLYGGDDEENAGGFMGNLKPVEEASKGNSYQAHLAKRGLLALDVNSSCMSSPRFAPLSPVKEEHSECETESRRSSMGSAL